MQITGIVNSIFTSNTFVLTDENNQDLIEKVEHFIQLSYPKKKQMGIAARKKVEREFDRNIVVNAYLEETRKVMDQKKTSSLEKKE